MSRAGLTLLETLVALVILGLVVVAGLELLAGTTRLSARSAEWSRAVVLAEDGLDQALVALTTAAALPPSPFDSLGDGFARRTDVVPWEEPGLARVDVTVTWPGGGRFVLSRLVAVP